MKKYKSILLPPETKDSPIVAYLWSGIDQLCNIQQAFSVDITPDELLEFKTSIVVLGNGIKILLIKCGFENEFAIHREILSSLKNAGIYDKFKLGIAMERIETAMSSYAEKFLDHEAVNTLRVLHAFADVDNSETLSMETHMKLSNMHTRLIDRVCEKGS